MTGAAARIGDVGADDAGGVGTAGEYTGQDVHHEGNAVALVLAHGQHDAVECGLRIRGGSAITIDGPAERNLLIFLQRRVDLPPGDARVGDVENDRGMTSSRCRNGPGIRPDSFLLAAPRGHGWTGIGGQDADTVGLRHPFRPVGSCTEVVTVSHRDDADAVKTGTAHRVLTCEVRDHLPDAVLPVEHREGTAVENRGRFGYGVHRSGPEPRDVPGQP